MAGTRPATPGGGPVLPQNRAHQWKNEGINRKNPWSARQCFGFRDQDLLNYPSTLSMKLSSNSVG